MNAATDTPTRPSLQAPLPPADALRLARRQFPCLCPDGCEPGPSTLGIYPVALAEIEIVTAYLQGCSPTSGVILSRHLQRAAGRWASRFISNGATIAAAIACGLEVRPAKRLFWPNALIGVELPVRRARR